VTPHVSITLLRTQSDDRLVKLTTAGHDRAFEAIVDRYRRPLLRYARRFLSESRAEDVVQAAFVSAWTALGDGAEVRDLRPWLYRIVHNGAVNAMKRPGGDDAPLLDQSSAGPGPEAQVEARDDVRRALDGIAALPDNQRAALVAVAVDGRAHADVAAELGLSDTAVRQLVRRARVSLRAAATALTPWPVAAWLAHAGAQHQDVMTTRIAEAVAGAAGTAGTASTIAGGAVSGAVIKTGAVVATVGVIAAGAPQVERVIHHQRGQRSSATSTAARAASAGPPALASAAAVGGPTSGAAQPVAATQPAGGAQRTHHGARHRQGRTPGTPPGAGAQTGIPLNFSAPAPSGQHHGHDGSGAGGPGSSGPGNGGRHDGGGDHGGQPPAGQGGHDGGHGGGAVNDSPPSSGGGGDGSGAPATPGSGSDGVSGAHGGSPGATRAQDGSGDAQPEDGTPNGSGSGSPSQASTTPAPAPPSTDH
jgi:RNA polymerase sigma factor (sigma-70 family)